MTFYFQAESGRPLPMPTVDHQGLPDCYHDQLEALEMLDYLPVPPVTLKKVGRNLPQGDTDRNKIHGTETKTHCIYRIVLIFYWSKNDMVQFRKIIVFLENQPHRL